MNDNIIELNGIKKTYRLGFSRKYKSAIEDLSLDVGHGEIFGLLGPNGAGKTTTLKILLGFVFPDGGTGTLLGKPLGDRKTRGEIGFLPEQPYFYTYLKAEKALYTYGKLFGMSHNAIKSKSAELLDLVGLNPNSHLTLDKYSKGMLQRFGIAQALINDPELVIMDEPSSGLDPIGQKEVRDILLQLRDQGKTIFLSSHQLSEVENICKGVCIVNHGRSIKEGNLSDMLVSRDTERVVLCGDTSVDTSQLAALSKNLKTGDGRVELEVDRGKLYAVLDVARELGLDLLISEPSRRSLEDIFLELVQDTKK